MRWLAVVVLLSGCVTVVRTTYPGDRRMWDGIFERAEALTLADVKPVAVVLPHHLVDAHELAGAWKDLATLSPPVVVLLGPDHYLRGPGITVPGHVTWRTEYGDLPGRALPGWPSVDSLFVAEHSLHVHSTFVQRLVPGATFMPVALTWGTAREKLEALAQQLHRELPADALVVASVDFSHYQPEPWASFHDEAAFSTVMGFHLEQLFAREVDSPESLFVAMRFAQLRGAQRATRWLHTNSQRRRTPFVRDSTSHQYFTFSAGAPEPRPSINVTLLPFTASTDLTHLRGQEDRFLLGSDLLVFSLQPGEEVTREVNGVSVLVTTDVDAHPSRASCVVVFGDARHEVSLAVKSGTSDADDVLTVTGPSLRLTRGFEALGVTCAAGEVRVRRLPLRLRDGAPELDFDAIGAALRPNVE